MTYKLSLNEQKLCLKEDLTQRIQKLVNYGKTSPIVSSVIIQPEDMSIDLGILSNMMDNIIESFKRTGLNITYDCYDGLRVTINNPSYLLNSPGGQCALDFSMKRFKRSYNSKNVTVNSMSPALAI